VCPKMLSSVVINSLIINLAHGDLINFNNLTFNSILLQGSDIAKCSNIAYGFVLCLFAASSLRVG